MEEKKKMAKWKKALIITFSSLFGLILVVVGTFYGIFFNEVNAFFTIKQENTNIYSMTYKNNYFFDEFLETGASTDAELRDFIMTKLLHGLPIDFTLPDYGCSSFTAITNEGEHTFARNLDIEFAPIMVVKTYPKNSYSSISMVNLSALGFSDNYAPSSFMDKLLLLAAPYIPFDGMNENGVAICVNMVNGAGIQQNTDKIDITTTTLIRLVLDKAASVEEAVKLIKQYDLHDSTGGPYHFQITDKSGKSVIVEYYQNEIQVIESETNFQIMTNHALNSFENDDSTFSSTYGRYDTIDNTLSQSNGILSVEESFNLLQEVKMSWDAYEGGNAGGALYSAVYNLDKLELQFVYKSNMDTVYRFTI